MNDRFLNDLNKIFQLMEETNNLIKKINKGNEELKDITTAKFEELNTIYWKMHDKLETPEKNYISESLIDASFCIIYDIYKSYQKEDDNNDI